MNDKQWETISSGEQIMETGFQIYEQTEELLQS
jgi:hypothetical protein